MKLGRKKPSQNWVSRVNSQDDAVSTTSEESVEDEADDPTASLEPIVVTDKWVEPPPLGEGWWGRGPPIQVHHNYRSRDLVDGGGLCSPGRWHPKNRLLPELGDVGERLINAMGGRLTEIRDEGLQNVHRQTCSISLHARGSGKR